MSFGKNRDILMRTVYDPNNVHFGSWTPNISLKHNGTTRTMGVRPQWRDYQSVGMAMVVMIMEGWVIGKLGGGAASTQEHSELEWVSTTEPCTLPAIMEMHLWMQSIRMPLLQPGSTTDSFVTNGGLYRRLLYFANLLLCSAAILKE